MLNFMFECVFLLVEIYFLVGWFGWLKDVDDLKE